LEVLGCHQVNASMSLAQTVEQVQMLHTGNALWVVQ